MRIEWSTTWNRDLDFMSMYGPRCKSESCSPADSLPMTNVIFSLPSIALRRTPLAWVRKLRNEFLGTAMVIRSGETAKVRKRVR